MAIILELVFVFDGLMLAAEPGVLLLLVAALMQCYFMHPADEAEVYCNSFCVLNCTQSVTIKWL